MASFFRINNNRLSSAGDIERLGFNSKNPMFIPDEYLEQQEFIIMRTCHGIGDWCIISSMPRLLKEKYPNCKVYIPSSTMLKNIYGNMLNNWGYGTYDCSQITHDIFKHNPYVDAFIDGALGEIFHDHYRVYNESNDKIPLVEQMLKFWQFTDDEIDNIDSTPDIFFNEEETQLGQKLIEKYWGENSFGYLGLTSTFGNTSDSEPLIDKVKEYKNMNWFYYGETPLEDTGLSFLKNVINVKNLKLNLRQQMFLKTKADVNIGNETGTNLWSSKYSPSYILGHKRYGKIHGALLENTVRKNPYKSGNFVRKINYI